MRTWVNLVIAKDSRKVFISYPTKDGLDWAIKTKDVLTHAGITAFLDKHDVKAGSPGWIKIGREISESQIIIIIGTAQSYYSYGVTLETEAALNLKKPIVTLRHDDAKIFEILYAPKFDPFETEEQLISRCSKITTDFNAIIEEHRIHMLRFQKDVADGGVPSQPTVTTGITPAPPPPNLSGLYMDKVNRALTEIKDAYESHTIVPSLARVRPFDSLQDSTKEFTQIYVSFFHPVKDFIAPQPALMMVEVGMAVAYGERNFINKQLFEKGPVTKISQEEVTIQKIRDILSDLKAGGFQPNVMLAPLEHYVDFMQSWTEQGCIEWRAPSREILLLDNETKLQVFWSNKYVPFHSDVLIMDNRIGEWIIKPAPNGQALDVRISRSALYPETRVQVTAKTTVHYKLDQPSGMRILKLS